MMYGKSILIQPLNQDRAPDPDVPPRLHIEFQKTSSGISPLTPFSYSLTRWSSKGRSAAHHHPANFCSQRFMIKRSAFLRSRSQSSSVPSMITCGNPQHVLHLNSKKLFVMSITVIFNAMFSSGDVAENAGDNSAGRPSTMFSH